MKKLSINPESINIIVLSHEHWDRIGGVNSFLYQNPNVDLFVPASFSANLKKEMVSRTNGKLYGMKNPQEICRYVYTTGELGSSIKE